MKKRFLLFAVLGFSFAANAQILVKNNQGEEIFSFNQNLEGILVNVNTGSTSLGVDYFFNDKKDNTTKYHIFRLGISGKANDGISSLVRAGEFSPGVNFNGSLLKIGVFAPDLINHKFNDWIELKANYSTDKYKLFNGDTTFKEQISSKRFDAYTIGAVYNMVLGSTEQNYFSIGLSLGRKSNYQDLSSIDVEDYTDVNNPTGNGQRRYGSTQTVRKGNFKMFDAYPLTISYTHLPKYQRPNKVDAKKNEIKVDKSNSVTQVISSPTRLDTIKRTSTDAKGKVVTTVEIIERKASRDTITTVTTEKVVVPNPFFKALKFGYAIFLNSDFTNTGDPAQSRLGTTIFLVSPNKDNILTSRIGLTAEIVDVFDTKKVNNGPLKRLNIGFTINFSI